MLVFMQGNKMNEATTEPQLPQNPEPTPGLVTLKLRLTSCLSASLSHPPKPHSVMRKYVPPVLLFNSISPADNGHRTDTGGRELFKG